MVGKENIAEILGDILPEDIFLVDVTISNSNTVCIYIDSLRGLTIDDCVSVSRKVESKLDRESEDFELQVSSPGIGQPFMVKQQYLKNTGRVIELLTSQDDHLTGKLETANEKGITILISDKEKSESGKKSKLARLVSLGYDEIRSAKTIVSFK